MIDNLTILGTSHISQQSIDEIKKTVEDIKPEIVAVELDKTRFLALINKEKSKIKLSDLPRIGVKGYFFALIGSYVQKKLGRIVNVEPGSDMLTAIEQAKKHKLNLALVDQPIEITLKRFSKEFSWKEKFRFVVDIFKGIFSPKKQLHQYGLESLDLRKVPPEKLVKKLIQNLRKRYPNVYKVLIKERNEYIAKKINHIIKNEPDKKILLVVGAGHQTDLLKLIKKYQKNNNF